MAKLDEFGEQIRKGEYKKTDIDQYDALKQEEKDIRDFCSKFSEQRGNASAAIQDIRLGLPEKIGNIADTDKKVLEMTKLLSALGTMEEELGWHEDESLLQKIKEIAQVNLEETEQAVRRLMKIQSDALKYDHTRFMGAETPGFLTDPAFKPKNDEEKKQQKESAALLMLTTATAYRQLKGLDKLCKLLNIEDTEQHMKLYKEVEDRSAAKNYVGLSEAGMLSGSVYQDDDEF